jgi:hypothetical protein
VAKDHCDGTSTTEELHTSLQLCRLTCMPQESTTVRVSRRTHQLLSDLADQRRTSVADLLDRLVEAERRRQILAQYNTRMAEVLADPAEQANWQQETAQSEVSTTELISVGEHAAIAR